jgi:hypothetical protein
VFTVSLQVYLVSGMALFRATLGLSREKEVSSFGKRVGDYRISAIVQAGQAKEEETRALLLAREVLTGWKARSLRTTEGPSEGDGGGEQLTEPTLLLVF